MAAAALAAVLFGACASQKPDPADRPDNVPRSSRVEPAPTRPSSPVRAELLADVEIIQPGVLFRLGVLLVMQPGWHVHWTNPGASGEPTEIVLRLPDGFTAGPLQWPTPTLVMQPDGGVGYGYRDRVLVHSKVRAPNLDPDWEWQLAADVSWLGCADDCAPGRTTLELWLPPSISGTRLPNHRNIPLFDDWSMQIPLGPHAPNRPFDVRTTGRLRPAGSVVSLEWRDAPAAVEWFPFAATSAAFRPATLDSDGRSTRIAFMPSASDSGGTDEVAGIVAYTDRAGVRRAAELSVPLGASGD